LMAYTPDDLANIQRAIATGTLSATVGGVQQTYRSLDDMLRIEAKIKAELGYTSNGGITWQTPAHSKGLTS
jgi:hypothetical protein